MIAKNHTILIAEDEARMRRILQLEFEQEGWDVLLAEDGDAALQLMGGQSVDLIITDLKMGKTNGLDLLRSAQAASPGVPAIVMTAFGSVDTAVEAMKLGASDYVAKPFEIDELRRKARRAIEEHALRLENRSLKAQLADREPPSDVVGDSPAMQRVFELMHQVADTPSTVLITGESGTGKEVLARALHKMSKRREAPFVVVNCAALTESLAESELFGHVRGAFTSASDDRVGRFELAGDGVIFLDELALINLNLQGKLLRVLQERAFERVGSTETLHVDARIIAATNKDLKALIADGTFREDLYYRLHVFEIALPPLRDRMEDVPLLAEHFLMKHAQTLGKPRPEFAEDALEALKSYHWPGNVRELENVLQRAILLCRGDVITKDEIGVGALTSGARPGRAALAPDSVGFGTPGFSLSAVIEDFERQCIERALEATGGNKSKAAQMLGVTRKMLRYKIEKYGHIGPNDDD